MSKGILGNEARQYLSPDTSPLTVEQQLEFERLAVEREKARLAVQLEELAIQVEREKFEIQKVRMEMEAELAIKVEREKAKIQIENKELEQDIVLSRSPFDLAKNIKLVPVFTEYDPEDYFRLFEETAKHLEWPAEQWVWLIKPKLSGKAAKVIRHLDDINDYDKVKKSYFRCILNNRRRISTKVS